MKSHYKRDEEGVADRQAVAAFLRQASGLPPDDARALSPLHALVLDAVEELTPARRDILSRYFGLNGMPAQTVESIAAERGVASDNVHVAKYYGLQSVLEKITGHDSYIVPTGRAEAGVTHSERGRRYEDTGLMNAILREMTSLPADRARELSPVHARVLDAVNEHLTPARRGVLSRLFGLNGMARQTVKDIAAQDGVAVSTVHVTKAYAFQALRKAVPHELLLSVVKPAEPSAISRANAIRRAAKRANDR